MVLRLQPGIIYGPIRSRRLGRSLGINLSPARTKMCSFDCVYCHYGHTERLARDLRPFADELPRADEVLDAVESALRSHVNLDFVTFSGNGEPTLHPDFSAIARGVDALRRRWRPQVGLALLSNSTGLLLDGVREVLPIIDVPVLKLDAGTAETMVAINRPARGISFADIVGALIAVDGILLQTLLVEGSPSNTSRDELATYFDLVREIAPREVQMYSTDRPVGHDGITRVSPDRLARIAEIGTRKTGVPMRAFFA